jgi:Zn-dependent peptidase ImmA (M78 family)/transcriptional regulator with XRE-family HTH domain
MAPPRSTEALVEPAILNWARSSAGLSIEEAAHSLQTKPEKVAAWEGGEASPSMSQLRKMAITYKRLLSDFYLPAPPAEEPLPHDFRRLPGDGAFRYSRALRYHLRQALQRRLLALDLAAELEVDIPVLSLRLRKEGDTELIGDQVRRLLGVSLALQRTCREPRKSYNAWRAAIEGAAVLVFQITGVSPQEILGFSIPERPCPIIAVNRKLTPNGRTYTLLHEFVHVLLNEGSICDIEEDLLRPPEEQDTEVFCNAVAAAALVPRDALLTEGLVAAYPPRPREWSDDDLSSLAHTFGISIHVILRRLLTAGRTTAAFYAARQAQWRVFEQRPAPDSEDEYRRNMPQEVVSDLGRPFTRLLLDSHLNSRMSLGDVARYLGLRAQQVERVREIVLRGG